MDSLFDWEKWVEWLFGRNVARGANYDERIRYAHQRREQIRVAHKGADPVGIGITQYKSMVEEFGKNEDHIQAQIEQQRKLAKQCMGPGGKGKDQALKHMRKVKMLRKRLAEARSIIEQMERQVHGLEDTQFRQASMTTMNAMRLFQKNMQGDVTVDDVQELQVNIRETMEESEAIGHEMALPLNPSQSEADELDAEDMLEELMREGDEPIATAAAAATSSTAVSTEDERLLEELRASMAVSPQPHAMPPPIGARVPLAEHPQ